MAFAKSGGCGINRHMAVVDSSTLKAVLGPTNTGKTHLAVERLCAHSSGMIGFPLRLLAREIYDRVVAIKGPKEVGLITGEEKIMPPGARWILATVESMPQDRDVAFVAIDEAQLCADAERGHVFTDRLLNARGREETMILGSDSLRPIVRALLPEAEITSRPRFSTLESAGHKKLSRLPTRTAIIGFSADEIYAAAEFIRRTRGGAAIVMGNLSPATRNAQVAMYQSGEVDFLVATDAVGMGLNMDLGHVAFASLTKFDGRRRRRLTVAELAQIAGRAGRHHRNGTFGTVSGAGQVSELTPEEIERIEEHRFPPLDHIRWRTPDLDMTSPADLLESLTDPPPHRLLRLAADALDEQVLRSVSADPKLFNRRWSPALTERLWRACRVPDFLKRGADFHAGFIGRLWASLGDGNGMIAPSWIGSELARLDSVQGDIDSLAGRIAAIRTWAYVSHQPDWLEDPGHWATRSADLEHKLSDALHRKLTERFVDRRTSMLLRSRADIHGQMQIKVGEDGSVFVDDEQIGSLVGFSFKPATAASHGETKALISAAEKRLHAELVSRAQRLVQAPDKDIRFEQASGSASSLLWQNRPVARINKGRSVLSPTILLDPAVKKLPAESQRLVEQRLSRWIKARVDAELGRLRWIAQAIKSKELSGGIRAILAALLDGLGQADRLDLSGTVDALTPTDRAWLKKAGITIGSLDIFMLPVLKPGFTELRLNLLCAAKDLLLPALPNPAFGLIDRPGPALAKGASLVGFRAMGNQMIRIDLLEQLAQELHRTRNGKESFQPTAKTAEALGIGEETYRRILRQLGFRPADPAGQNRWRWHGLTRDRQTRPDNPAFEALGKLARR